MYIYKDLSKHVKQKLVRNKEKIMLPQLSQHLKIIVKKYRSVCKFVCI